MKDSLLDEWQKNILDRLVAILEKEKIVEDQLKDPDTYLE